MSQSANAYQEIDTLGALELGAKMLDAKTVHHATGRLN